MYHVITALLARSVHLERLANSGQNLVAYVTTRSVNLRVWSCQKVYGKAPIICVGTGIKSLEDG
jgi:hypothetical protein